MAKKGPRYSKTCEFCAAEFETKEETQRYCCAACARDAQRRPANVCQQCDKEFKAKYAEQKYCSRACKTEACKKYNTRICPTCGDEFVVGDVSHNKNQVFCSHSCHMKQRNKGFILDKTKQLTQTQESVDAPRYDGHRMYVNANGYPTVKIDKKSFLVHRLVMSKHLGRELLTTEHVHHKNGDRSDFNISNLEVWLSAKGARQPTGVNQLEHVKNLISLLSEEERQSLL